jgi:dihydropteroate synthase
VTKARPDRAASIATPYPAGPLRFTHRLGTWDLTQGPRIVGILNVTPDSFSDGGRYLSPEDALARALALAEEGADAIDVGGQSTRPKSGAPVSADEEWDRIATVVRLLVSRLPAVPVSVDTYRGEVARRALDAGAAMVNDVSGLAVAPEIADAAAGAGAGLVLMHSRGAPDRLHETRDYPDVGLEVREFLIERLQEAVSRGMDPERIALDPGAGFSKRAEQTIEALRGLPLLTDLGRPLYIGVSRKSFLGALTGEPVDRRVAAGLGATIAAFALGGRIFRTHDVRETRDALRVARAILDDEVNPASILESHPVESSGDPQPVPERRV